MAHGSDERLLVLHGLRLKSVTDVEALAGLWSLDPDDVRHQLGALCGEGLATWRQGTLAGWTSTRRGREEGELLVATELAEAGDGARATLEQAYQQFLPLNRELLAVCTAWQVRGETVNRHDDAHYDAEVLQRLRRLHRAAQPVIADLAGVFLRFDHYEERLASALRRIAAGEMDYFTKPVIDSYHTVWFELHQDLLVTLGRDRAEEEV